MSKNKTILSVVVGSRLHGLNSETSDWDIRGIFIHDMIDILSPFRQVKNTSWVEGNEDNTAYEFRDFCKYAVHGNPTIIEILYSNMIRVSSSLGKELQKNSKRFLDSKRIYEAHKGYGHNQYTKMNLFEPDARTPKFAVAYLRSMQQGIELLETGILTPQVTANKEFMLEVKYNFSPDLVPELGKQFTELSVKLTETYIKNQNKFTPDIEWIENLIMRAYMGKDA